MNALRARGGLVVVLLVLGPACAGDDEDESSSGSASGSATSGATGDTTGASTTAGSDSGTGSTGASTTTAGSATNGGSTFDVGNSSDGGGAASIYEACEEDEDCMAGLDCIPIGLDELIVSQCTVNCNDASECPDGAGGEVGCVPSPLGGAGQCSYVCGPDVMCPAGYSCWNDTVENAPCSP